ncbi:MAG: hypothetical protein N3A64_00490 [Desulfobacterota bacterium]|nr:hypothetical protein [Thermodesulfobacteriota bacterium]
MPVVQYLCDHCGKVLEKIVSEKYPANLTYSPPNTISHFFQCSASDCTAKFIAWEEESGKLIWELKEEETFQNILKGVNERKERAMLKEEKEKLIQEKAQLERMLSENPQRISIIKKEMEEVMKLSVPLKVKVNQGRNWGEIN